MFARSRGLVSFAGLLLFLAGETYLQAQTPEEAALQNSFTQTGQWEWLGQNPIVETGNYVSSPSLTADPRPNPVLAFSTMDGVTYEDTTFVSRWNGKTWVAVGQPVAGAGPSIGLDSERRIYLCTNGGPYVYRWNGATWVQIGGDIALEAGYRIGPRHVVDSCGGIVLDSEDVPTVTWAAYTGAKIWTTYAARWDKRQQKWIGLGPDALAEGRDAGIYLDIDARDRPYVATYETIGAGLSRVTTTRVLRWNGNAWNQLGPDMPYAENPVIGVYNNKAYLAIQTDNQVIKVMRWLQDSWQELPSPGNGVRPILDFTLSGKPVIAYLDELTNESGETTTAIRVKFFRGEAWFDVGDAVATTTDSAAPDLSIDAKGQPTVVWTEIDYINNFNMLFIMRLNVALP